MSPFDVLKGTYTARAAENAVERAQTRTNIKRHARIAKGTDKLRNAQAVANWSATGVAKIEPGGQQ